ncbi:hypothetical protein AKJ65_07015 [candidate division MSBL1 archaeon SCGC-AAA259E19]|uniref:Uncharacterized protein n=1 Tax=candidate division MSBL1 archaeon SCGC-AAA259E19 TaxID=1698264 RepID=A0A133UF24_9EURY|nr:hypothetical protein AKJ65_07015 [candidate division MSBL1 archaeon SCGC-AAA259E19]
MGLVSQVKGLEKEIVEQVIYSIENELIEEMCGEEYERTRYQRLDTKPRTLKTSIGTLELDLKKVKDKETGEVFSPVERKLKMPNFITNSLGIFGHLLFEGGVLVKWGDVVAVPKPSGNIQIFISDDLFVNDNAFSFASVGYY